jgi:hypothetical protein
MSVQEKVREETTKWVGPRPLTFAQFLELYGAKDQVELIDGVVVERSSVRCSRRSSGQPMWHASSRSFWLPRTANLLLGRWAALSGAAVRLPFAILPGHPSWITERVLDCLLDRHGPPFGPRRRERCSAQSGTAFRHGALILRNDSGWGTNA